jgi:hypothetical protein
LCSSVRCGVSNNATGGYTGNLAGFGNTIGGTCYNVVVGGFNNTASGTYYSFIGNGSTNTASGTTAAIVNGTSNYLLVSRVDNGQILYKINLGGFLVTS